MKIAVRVCRVCGEPKLLWEYPISYGSKLGHERRCKSCRSTWLREYRQSPQVREARRAYRVKYYASEKGREVAIRGVQKYQAKFPLKHKARIAVTHAIEAGRLPRAATQECRHCGLPAGSWHHCSYAEADWLKVVPLCGPCHTQEHQEVQNV